MFPTLIFAGLAAAQLTYLIVDAVLLDEPRNWVLARENDGFWWGKLAYLVTCPWCASAWASAAAVAILHNRLDYEVVAVFVVWWFACLTYFILQAVANRADV